ncbi:MAG TPA: cytochrome c oxidase subunit II [Pyrinomonadaceae bacterium]|jgi:cytochrome c oxidase subunit 2|nr:cytochrome c oxidase subunit II [Pyrinomonadaceae bacterium]
MGRALGVLIWVITLASVLLFTHTKWWFPPSISEHGPAYDRQFVITIIVVGLSFAAAQIGLGYAVWRYRATPDASRATYSHGNNRLEILWTVITAGIFITLAVMGQRVWAGLHFENAPAGSARVHVTAQQFQWNFHYPGMDDKFGRTRPDLINDSSLNFVGLDETDAASKDDSVVGSLIVEVNRPVELVLRARDVTHSFWVPQLRFKQDAVPGLDIRVHFTPQVVGRYEIACAELCGQLHYKMKSYMLVLPEAEYREIRAMPQAQFQKRVTELYARPEYQVKSY